MHLEWVAFDACLELLIAIVCEPDRTAWKKHRGERDIEWERRMVATAEAAAKIGEMAFDARRLEGGTGFSQEERDRLGGFVRRLHAEHDLEFLAAGVVPREPTFGLEKHRIDGLSLKFAIQHQNGRIVCRKLRANFLAIGGALGIWAGHLFRKRCPYRELGVLEAARADPAFLDRRVDVGRVRRRAGHPRKAEGAVVGQPDRTRFLPELDERSIAQREPSPIEGVELLEDQQRHRLAEINRR